MTGNPKHSSEAAGVGDSAHRQHIAKGLADTRWDGLRTPFGLGAVIAVAMVVLFVAPVLVWFVEDPIGLVPVAFVGSVYLTWFLLRRVARFVTVAPDEALDERLIAIRNRTYLLAYRALAGVFGLIAGALLVWSIVEIRSGAPAASFSISWPQVNALIWFVLAQILLMPSLTLALGIRRRKVQL